jgi:hypothetical protein
MVVTIDGASKAGKFSTIITSIASYFFSFSMAYILGSIKGLSLICAIASIQIAFPAVQQRFMQKILEFVTFDVFESSTIYDYLLGDDPTDPLNDNFEEAGYGS